MTAVPIRQIIERRTSHEEIRDTGKCTLAQRLTAEVKAGNRASEIRNPQGFCCLGNVNSAVKRAMNAVEAKAQASGSR
jgi:hypothetical protein